VRLAGYLLLEIEVIVIPASWIEHRVTGWTLIGTRKVLSDGQLGSAYSAQNSGLIQFRPRPDLDRMTGYRVVAVLTGVVSPTAPHLDRNDIQGLSVMDASRLSVDANSVHMR